MDPAFKTEMFSRAVSHGESVTVWYVTRAGQARTERPAATWVAGADGVRAGEGAPPIAWEHVFAVTLEGSGALFFHDREAQARRPGSHLRLVTEAVDSADAVQGEVA